MPLLRIPWGGHIGFEDNVNLDFTLPGILGLWQKLLFTIVNILIFQVLRLHNQLDMICHGACAALSTSCPHFSLAL